MQEELSVQFFHPKGQKNVRHDIDIMLSSANISLRAAVCFFTEPGRIFLSRYSCLLNKPESFFVANVDAPTNIDALADLHNLAPGHVFIHLGGVTPVEKGVGRALMHSKVFLAESDEYSELWVGSHNLTAMALEGGNFEAGLKCKAPVTSKLMQDALSHLTSCRDHAEPFNPNDIQRYKEIQDQRLHGGYGWDIERSILVLHAEAGNIQLEPPFIVTVNIDSTEYDKHSQVDRKFRLFLHKEGTLSVKRNIDYKTSILYKGIITGIVRTERHPSRGTGGVFANANFSIVTHDDIKPPSLEAGYKTSSSTMTQIIVRLDEIGSVDDEIYSISSRFPFSESLLASEETTHLRVDHDMIDAFTKDSVDFQGLIYKQAIGVKEMITLTGYEEKSEIYDKNITYHRGHFQRNAQVIYSKKSIQNFLNKFFFMSHYVIRKKE
jgi:hypothetical protein